MEYESDIREEEEKEEEENGVGVWVGEATSGLRWRGRQAAFGMDASRYLLLLLPGRCDRRRRHKSSQNNTTQHKTALANAACWMDMGNNNEHHLNLHDRLMLAVTRKHKQLVSCCLLFFQFAARLHCGGISSICALIFSIFCLLADSHSRLKHELLRRKLNSAKKVNYLSRTEERRGEEQPLVLLASKGQLVALACLFSPILKHHLSLLLSGEEFGSK